ncbi:bifunctional UDP-sugar hydrolase/5'-nucleotidase [Bacillus sp. OK048]|uniref:bifunctional metallophosphatase/5'-nucleotidase n=1 Tax=Bacillus sp. OK048 TaxID=1882761 RepID=UPI00088F25B5|nr:bifunctional UDP-sugar hydrolase/5'-nucleotidase [Bacillus sp. OK048]SDM75069.1 2',3'-cyclic-nucleotide 2'-phosphodiesterase/5'-or 3'-nucleotidase, 5'-nucleotidase family [Bacillus sp. OK048]
MEFIHIYHTNDLHSHLKRWPRNQHFLTSKRTQHEAAGEDFFLFDIGDFIDRWHPLSEATQGQGNIKLLNEAGYTAVTIGNNEGINFPYEGLNHLYDNRDFDVVVANLYNSKNQHPSWLIPYKIYQTKSGTRIGVIGLTANFSLLYELLGWKLTNPIEELKRWMEPLKEDADIIILLSHLGLNHDERIAVVYPEIDVILGGHTHHALPEGKQVGQTLIAGAGKHGRFIGQVTLQVVDRKPIHQQAKLYNVMELPAVQDEKAVAKELYRKGKKLLNQTITTLTNDLPHDPFQETELSQILCRALREWCDADCAFINGGLILGPLSGTVTAYDLLTICPHPINPCKIYLTGKELTEVLLETRDENWSQRQITGLGFRGTIMGISVYDGITFDENNVIFINGMELELEGNYTLAIPDMFTFGHFFKEIFPNKKKEYFLPEFLRDLLKWKLEK